MLGTINKDGISNLGLFNSIFHVGANPPLLEMISDRIVMIMIPSKIPSKQKNMFE